jgi:hypothetical protein
VRGEQQRHGVSGGEECGVHRHQPPQRLQHLVSQPAYVQAAVAVADHVALSLDQAGLPRHDHSVLLVEQSRNPSFLGWSYVSVGYTI